MSVRELRLRVFHRSAAGKNVAFPLNMEAFIFWRLGGQQRNRHIPSNLPGEFGTGYKLLLYNSYQVTCIPVEYHSTTRTSYQCVSVFSAALYEVPGTYYIPDSWYAYIYTTTGEGKVRSSVRSTFTRAEQG